MRGDEVDFVEVHDGDRRKQGASGAIAAMSDSEPIWSDPGAIRREREQFVSSVHHEASGVVKDRIRQCLHHDLGADAVRLAHADPDHGEVVVR